MSLLAFSSIQLFAATAINSPIDDVIADLGQEIPLTTAQIEKQWPNLPSAKELYKNDICVVIDLKYSGKQLTSLDDELPDPNSPTIIDMKSAITNCTTTTIDYQTGALKPNTPQIWLQYDDTTWIKVPPKYLQTPITDPQTPTRSDPMWAIGMYANPGETPYSTPVTGVVTYGEWHATSFGSSGKFLFNSLLTALSNGYIAYRVGMQLVQ